VPESQATSREARPCRETGEELLRKHGFPLDDQVQQLTGLAQEALALRATELVRPYGSHEAMARGAGIVLLKQGRRLGNADNVVARR